MTDTNDTHTNPSGRIPGTSPDDQPGNPAQDPDLPYAETMVAIPALEADGQPTAQVITGVRTSATETIKPALTAETTPPRNVFAVSFSHIHRSAAFIRLGLTTPKKNMDIPGARHATYLMLNAGSIEFERDRTVIRDEIGIIAGCRDFEISEDNAGNLVIVALSERGGVEKLFDIERSIRNAIPAARILIGECTIERTGQTEFSLTDSNLDAKADNTLALSSVEGSTSITSPLAAKINDPESRVGSNIKLYSDQTTNPNFVRLIEAISLVSKEQGGPDRLIGYNNEFATLLKSATDEETGIILLEGAAGMGKSRLRTELLNRLPNSVTCSCEASDRNIVGSSLVTLANQLTETIEKDEFSQGLPRERVTVKRVIYEGDIAMTGDQIVDEQAVTLQEFKDWRHADRIKFAAKHPEVVADLCYNALVKLKDSRDPKTLFVLEDLHHTDRISEPFLIDLAKRYCQPAQNKPQAKALITARPEEMYQSQAFKRLKTQGTRVITLKGLELLERDDLGRDFAYYSLPPTVREKRGIGIWYRTLARKSRKSPLMMKSFMDQVKVFNSETNAYPNLQIIGGVVEVKRDCLEEIGKIKSDSDSDVATYFQERIATLPLKERRLLQCIALMEERLTPWQTIQLADKVLGINPTELSAIASRLTNDAGYFVEDKLNPNSCRLQHEAMRGIVISSIEDNETKIRLAKSLYELFKEDESLAVKTKHALAHVIGTNMPQTVKADHENFWQEYSTLTEQLFADAQYHNDAQYGYEIAKEALGLPVVQSCVSALCHGSRTYPEQLETLAIKCLMVEADYAKFLGKFDEAQRSIEKLKALHAHLQGVVDILEVHLINFEKACMESDPKKLAIIYEEIQNCGKPVPKSVQVTLDIRLAVFRNKFADAIALYRENKAFIVEEAKKYAQTHSSPYPIYMELQRICEAKCPYELLRRTESHVDGHEFDDDVIKQRRAFTPQNQRQLESILNLLVDINKVARSHQMVLNPWSEVKVIEQQGEMLACLEQYDEALPFLSETWRIAMQLGLYDHAARVAKEKGDTEIMQALTGPKKDRIKLIEKAIETYGREGITEAASHVSEQSDFQFILRIERIRAIGILALENPQDLIPYIKTAIEDFKYLNKTPHWAEMATDPKHRWHSIIHYYLMGYVGHILKTASAAGIKINEYLDRGEDIYDETEYPYMDIECLERAIEMGDNMTDLEFGEVERKVDGLHILAKALHRRKHMLDKHTRKNQEELFRHNGETVEVPRGYTATMKIGMDTREVLIIDPIKPHELGFIESVGIIRGSTQRIVEANHERMPSEGIEQDMSEAMAEFVRLNNDNPELSRDPESLYQVMGYIGQIVRAAQQQGVQIDDDIFNGERYPYIKLENVLRAYKFGQRVVDLGHQGESEKKMDGLFELLNILREKQHQQKKKAHQQRDRASLEKRAM